MLNFLKFNIRLQIKEEIISLNVKLQPGQESKSKTQI